jgi:hypothetical protein
MYPHPPRQRNQLPLAARRHGTHLRRLAAALAAVTCGLLASAAIVPTAAFAMTEPVPTGGGGAPPVTTVISAGGMAGWQIALIALGAALAAAAATLLADRAMAARRAGSATTA